MAAQASFAGVAFGLPAFAPALRAAYHLRLLDVGLVLGAPSIGMLLGLIPWGLAADRLGERFVLTVGMTGAALIMGLTALTTRFTLLVPCLTIAGVFGASANIASGRAVMHAFSRDERGLALGIRQTAATIGTACAAASLPAIGNPRTAFFALSGACMATAAAAALAVPAAAVHHSPQTAYTPLRDRRIWRLCYSSAFICVGQNSVTAFVVLFLHDREGVSPSMAGVALVVVNILGTVLRIGVGVLSDRVARPLHLLMWTALAFTAGLLVSAALVDAPRPAVIATMIVTGGLALSWNGLSYAATAELAGAARSGAALGLQQTLLTASSATAPVAFSVLVAATSWRISYAVASAAPLIGTLMLGSLVREERLAVADESVPTIISPEPGG